LGVVLNIELFEEAVQLVTCRVGLAAVELASALATAEEAG
jgi:hypothetical protein